MAYRDEERLRHLLREVVQQVQHRARQRQVEARHALVSHQLSRPVLLVLLSCYFISYDIKSKVEVTDAYTHIQIQVYFLET